MNLLSSHNAQGEGWEVKNPTSLTGGGGGEGGEEGCKPTGSFPCICPHGAFLM